MKLSLPLRLMLTGGKSAAVSRQERAMLADLDAERRLQLLRYIVPGLLVLLLISAPGTLHTSSLSGYLQLTTGLLTYSLAWWATLQRRAAWASLALLTGVTLRSLIVILFDGPVQGHLTPATFTECYLLLLPIALAAIFTEPRIVALTTALCVVFTAGIFIAVPQSAVIHQALVDPTSAVLYVLPLAIPVLVGFLLFVGTQGFRRVQRELADAHLALAREKEMERLREQFISNVNHELRTPLMALQTYLALATTLGQRGETHKEQHALRQATTVVEDLVQLVRSVLNVRKVHSDAAIERTSIVLADFMHATLQTVERWNVQHDERDVHLHIPTDLVVWADADRLQEVVTNLLTNAIKYSPAHSRIEVSATAVAPTATFPLPPAPGKVRLVEVVVRDYGQGIPPDQAVLLFQPFVRLARDITSPVQGTGLGLAICRTHVEAMGGTIWIDSTGIPGAGTAFHFTLPAVS